MKTAVFLFGTFMFCCVVVEAGLVAQYTFDGATGTEDSTGQHHGTLAGHSGGATVIVASPGVPGTPAGNKVLFVDNPTASFSDSAQRMRVAAHPDFNFSGTMTLALWMCPVSLPEGVFKNQGRLVCRKGFPPNWSLQYRTLTRDMRWQISAMADANTLSDIWNWGEWYHVALVYDHVETQTCKIYVNAEEMLSRPTGANLATGNDEVLIGCAVDNGYATAYAFHGYLDDVIFFNTALTQDEIKDIMKPARVGTLLIIK